ncbi:hypothetical protein [Nocardia neocaledoniensis]|uniref:hypothetical protein n=1 Tax=Nocardia neocaledoniensis TaxID=236511 RepID=UPI002458FBA5|nr:hypothetical protein [Nocardia neocaledoniensis]
MSGAGRGSGQPTMVGDVFRGILVVVVTIGGLWGALGVVVGLVERDMAILGVYVVWSLVFAILGVLVFWWIKVSRTPGRRGVNHGGAAGFSPVVRPGAAPDRRLRELPGGHDRWAAGRGPASGGPRSVPSQGAAPGDRQPASPPGSGARPASGPGRVPSGPQPLPPGGSFPAYGTGPGHRRPAPTNGPAAEDRGGFPRPVDRGSATTRASVPSSQADARAPLTPPAVHSPSAETQADNLFRRPLTPPARPVAPSDPTVAGGTPPVAPSDPTIRRPFPDDAPPGPRDR